MIGTSSMYDSFTNSNCNNKSNIYRNSRLLRPLETSAHLREERRQMVVGGPSKDAFCDGFNISPLISNSDLEILKETVVLASIGIQYISQRPLFNSLFIHGTGSEKSAGVDDLAETIRNVGVRNTSKCHGLCQSSVVSQGVHESVHQNQLTHTPTLVQASHVDYTSKVDMRSLTKSNV
ncbi:hypothetical protein Tco_0383643 [Tanacetum coccineum]